MQGLKITVSVEVRIEDPLVFVFIFLFQRLRIWALWYFFSEEDHRPPLSHQVWTCLYTYVRWHGTAIYVGTKPFLVEINNLLMNIILTDKILSQNI